VSLPPNVGPKTGYLLGQTREQLSTVLKPGFFGPSWSDQSADLHALFDLVDVGLVGVHPHSPEGGSFLLTHYLNQGSPGPLGAGCVTGSAPPQACLGVRAHDHLIVSLPIWAMLVEDAAAHQLLIWAAPHADPEDDALPCRYPGLVVTRESVAEALATVERTLAGLDQLFGLQLDPDQQQAPGPDDVE
jgi:hypothetical protein